MNKDITIIITLYKTPIKVLKNLEQYRNFKVLIFEQEGSLESKKKLGKSLNRDEMIFALIKMNLKKLKLYRFKYKVLIKKSDYIKMIRNRFISCLIYLPKKEILKGIKEIKNNFKDLIKFDDVLECIFYKK